MERGRHLLDEKAAVLVEGRSMVGIGVFEEGAGRWEILVVM